MIPPLTTGVVNVENRVCGGAEDTRQHFIPEPFPQFPITFEWFCLVPRISHSTLHVVIASYFNGPSCSHLLTLQFAQYYRFFLTSYLPRYIINSNLFHFSPLLSVHTHIHPTVYCLFSLNMSDDAKPVINTNKLAPANTVPVTERAIKRRKCVIGTLTCLFIIVVISLSVGLSVGLSVRNSKWYKYLSDAMEILTSRRSFPLPKS
jgi:hypothetical protein